MNTFIKQVILAVLGISLMVPAFAYAASLTSDQITSIINLLQSFGAPTSTITQVQAVLNGQPLPHIGGDQNNEGDHGVGGWAQGSTTVPMMPPGQIGKMACIVLNRNLSVGSQGEDVRQLQDLLAQDPTTGFTASSTGFFGPMTARALAHFQEENGIASSSTGIVGPLTRGFFERHCGEGLDGEHGMMASGTPPMPMHR